MFFRISDITLAILSFSSSLLLLAYSRTKAITIPRNIPRKPAKITSCLFLGFECLSGASAGSNINGTHSINDLSPTRHMNNMTESEKRPNGGK